MSVKRKSSVRISPNLDEAPQITDRWVAELTMLKKWSQRADSRRGPKQRS